MHRTNRRPLSMEGLEDRHLLTALYGPISTETCPIEIRQDPPDFNDDGNVDAEDATFLQKVIIEDGVGGSMNLGH